MDNAERPGTHLLQCAHQIGNSRKTYFMHCDVLKEMPDGRLKLRVYGERNWRGKDHETRVRYVSASRVHVKGEDQHG